MAEAKKAPSMPTFMQYVRLLDLASAAMMVVFWALVGNPTSKKSSQCYYRMLSTDVDGKQEGETRTGGVFCLNRRTSSSFIHTRKDGPQAGTAVRF